MAKAITLRQNTVCIDAAIALYHSWGAFYGEPLIAFDKLPPVTRHLWVERAKDVLEMVGPRRQTAWAEFEAGANTVRRFGDGA